MIAYGVFDSEALNLMQVAFEQTLAALPPDQQTAEVQERIAQAVVNLATATQRESESAQMDAMSLAERTKRVLSVGQMPDEHGIGVPAKARGRSAVLRTEPQASPPSGFNP